MDYGFMSREGETILILGCKYVSIFKAVTQVHGYSNVPLSLGKKKKYIFDNFNRVSGETLLGENNGKSSLYLTEYSVERDP